MVQTARPDSTVSAGTWVTNDGAGTLWDHIDEVTADDADFINSATDPVSDTCEVGLSDVTDPASSTGHIVRYRYGKRSPSAWVTTGKTIDITAALYQGATQIASWTHANVGLVAQAEQTLTGAQADAITSYPDLRLRFVANVSGGGAGRAGGITWAMLEVPDAGGPQTFFITPSGSVTPSGALARQVGKPLGGAASPAGVLVKEARKALVGALTPAGSLARQARKPLAGSSTPFGTLASSLVKLLSVSGSASAVGSLVRRTGKALAGQAAASGVLARTPSKALGGSATPIGAVATTKVVLLSLGGSVTAIGSLARRVSKGLGGQAQAAGALARRAGKRLAGSATPTGTVVASRKVLISLAGSVAASGALAVTATVEFFWRKAGVVYSAARVAFTKIVPPYTKQEGD